jgi:hypothetical protein
VRVRTLLSYLRRQPCRYFYFIYLVYNKQVITFELSHCYLLPKMQFNAELELHVTDNVKLQIM